MLPPAGGPLDTESAREEAVAPPTEVTLEFRLAGDNLSALGLSQIAAPRPTRLVWYDDADRNLAAEHLSLAYDGATWQLDRLLPDDRHDWPACQPPPPLSRAEAVGDLTPPIGFEAAPVTVFEGTLERLRSGPVTVDILRGTVRGLVDERPVCRVTLRGPGPALSGLLDTLADTGLSIPRATLAQEALAAADSAVLPARHRGAPALHGNPPVGDGLATILSHLLDVLLFWTDTIRAGCEPEAVHQARVTTRRLRSALSIYRPASPVLDRWASDVKRCAALLGAVRDWDVFLAGSGAMLAEASGNDARVVQLLRTAARRREEAAAALSLFLSSPAFRHLELGLGTAAALRPWASDADADAPALAEPTATFAAGVLTRRLKRARRRGRKIGTLPIEALHELRKDCKRLRYAVEFFAPAFPSRQTRRFLRRSSDLQEHLGTLNDTAASVALMGQLGRAGRGYAGGMANGLAAAAALPARTKINKSWKRFRRVDPFWQ